MPRYLVQRRIAGRWLTLRSFEEHAPAVVFAAWFGRRVRVRHVEV